MKFQDVKYLVVHCSATAASQDVDLAEIDRWHRKRGFVKVGYHFVIKRNGEVQQGRSLTEAGAHAQGFNNKSIGICLVGGVAEKDKKTAEDNFTNAQLDSLADLLFSMAHYYPDAEVLGHRDLPSVHKDCPSFDVRKWWASVQEVYKPSP